MSSIVPTALVLIVAHLSTIAAPAKPGQENPRQAGFTTKLALAYQSKEGEKRERVIYLWYFRRILPLVGRLLSKHTEAYAYLPASVSAFLTPDALAALLRASGFFEIRVDRLTCGVVCLYVGRKPPAS